MSLQPYTIEADRHLEQRVGQALAKLHYPSLRQIKVSARGGTVTLSGRVHSFHEKELAQHSLGRIPGVSHVVDFLQVHDPHNPAASDRNESERSASSQAVKPATQEIAERRLDYRLQVRVVASLAYEPAFRQLSVQVFDKIATLEGIVATQTLKDTAGEVARQVASIVGVENKIVVDAETLREADRAEKAKTAWQRADWRAEHRATALVAAALLLFIGWQFGWSRTEANNLPTRMPVVAVEGHLSVDGEAPEGAMVIFHRRSPAETAHPTPMGIVDKHGGYRLTTYEADDGAPAGEYTVTIFWKPGAKEGAPAAPPSLPERYATATSSPLRATINETTLRVPLEVTRK